MQKQMSSGLMTAQAFCRTYLFLQPFGEGLGWGFGLCSPGGTLYFFKMQGWILCVCSQTLWV